uniref:Uncharacterized protein n=1 Tax=Candidatus Kentrum sp. TC TaxID=2126339 RepID=A0A450YCW0_9GAMM|nr:MAG: hypothetical protein BECKTC1821D_GA0114238_100621 [Candidatus Kentron sp. TC]
MGERYGIHFRWPRIKWDTRFPPRFEAGLNVSSHILVFAMDPDILVFWPRLAMGMIAATLFSLTRWVIRNLRRPSGREDTTEIRQRVFGFRYTDPTIRDRSRIRVPANPCEPGAGGDSSKCRLGSGAKAGWNRKR